MQVNARSTTSDEEQTFRARCLVACDGARSNIRRDLGITTVKSSVSGTSAEVIIESPEMKAIPLAQTLGRCTLVEATGMALSLPLPFDGRDQYRMYEHRHPGFVRPGREARRGSVGVGR